MAYEEWTIHPGENTMIEADGVRTLKVGMVGGHVDVIGHDEPETRVEIGGVTMKDVRVTLVGDRLEIDHLQKRWTENIIEAIKMWTSKARAEVSILVPRHVAVRLGVVSASALVAGIHSDLKLSTVSGEITTDETRGELDVNGVSGEISLREHSGRIRANTVSGDITATGAITRIATKGVSGNTYLDVTGSPEEIASNTVSGDLTLRLDDSLGARYRVNSVSGRLQFDDVIHVMQAGKGFVHETGERGGRWVDIAINSVSGNITVVRADASMRRAASA